MHPALVSLIYNKTVLSPINVSLEAKARDLTKEVGPWWGLLIIAKSRDRDFWISSDYRCHLGLEDVKDLVTSWLTAALPGRLVLNQRWQLGSVGIFYTHVHDGGWGEHDMVHTVSINFISSLFFFKWIHPYSPGVGHLTQKLLRVQILGLWPASPPPPHYHW